MIPFLARLQSVALAILVAGCGSAAVSTAPPPPTAAPRAPSMRNLSTPRGAQVPIAVAWPEGTRSPAPAIVIAPGSGYHMDRPLPRRLAERAVAQGFVAVRFDWSFCQQAGGRCTGKESADGSAEREDLETVLAFVRTEPTIDRSRIVLAGKSLGSLVAYPIFARDEALRALMLLTPICTKTESKDGSPLRVSVAAKNYPGLHSLRRPVLFAVGDADPACSIPMLREYVASAPAKASIVEGRGDHGFELGDDSAFAEQNAANIAATVENVVRWAADVTKP